MKTQELLDLYRQGERNFRRQDLSGVSFKGQNLANADFSGADLRGANFTSAILQNAKFSDAQVGLRRQDKILLLGLLLLLAALLGTAAGFVGTLLNLELRDATSGFEETIAGWAMLLLLLGFAVLAVLEGITTGFSVFPLAFMAAVALITLAPLFATLINPLAFTVASAIALAITIIASATALTLFTAILAVMAFESINPRAGVLILLCYVGFFSLIVSITGIVTSVVPVVSAVTLLSAYLGWRALQGDPRQAVIRRVVNALSRPWGTSFRNADLTRADFSNVVLKDTHFEGANLTRVCWNGSDPAQEGAAYGLR